MKKLIIGALVLVLVGFGVYAVKSSKAVLTVSWECKMRINADGSGGGENWSPLRKPIYFTETQAEYIIERESDTLKLSNLGANQRKYMLCTKL